MRRVRCSVSAWALLAFALMYFFDGIGLVAALAPAVLTHELGHALALRLCGSRLTRLRVSVTGAMLDYAPRVEGLRAVACCAAGPLAGAVYAVAACTLGGRFWRMSGAASCLLSAFNLLPILPLDGGRIVAELLPGAQARRVSLAAAGLLCAGGAALALRFSSFTLLGMGVWLVACNFGRKE